MFKGKSVSSDSRSRQEINTKVGGLNIEATLHALGYNRIASFSKIRETFLFGDVEIALDTLEMGAFMEFEMLVRDEQDVPAAEETIMETAALLGITRKDIVDRSYLELYLETHEKQK